MLLYANFIKYSVCQIAKKRCKMVLTEFTECSITSRDINYPGRGNGNFLIFFILREKQRPHSLRKI